MSARSKQGREQDPDPVELLIPAPSPLSPSLDEVLQEISSRTGASPDIVIRRFASKSLSPLPLAFIYIDGLVSADLVNQTVLQPLMDYVSPGSSAAAADDAYLLVKDRLLPVGGVKEGFTESLRVGTCFSWCCFSTGARGTAGDYGQY